MSITTTTDRSNPARFLFCDGCGLVHKESDEFIICECGRIAARMEWATPEQILIERFHLARLVPPGGTVIELGVAAGRFAAEMLEANGTMTYIGIDRWSDHHDEVEMDAAYTRASMAAGKLSPDKQRVFFKRGSFDEVVKEVKPECADMVYVDGYAHTGQEGGETLRDWWPAVKPGGIFAGHDYCAKYQPTIDAVDAFVALHGLELHIIDDGDHPSWWVRKPV